MVTAQAAALIFIAALSFKTRVDAASMNVHSLVSFRAQQYVLPILSGQQPSHILLNCKLVCRYFAGVPNSSDVKPELRAALQNAITKQPESVAAGSDFPDFLYACGTYAVSLS